MTKPIATPDERRLHAFLDGELTPAERAEVEQWLARDAHARAHLDGLRLLQRAITGGFEAEADKVPEARFEQIWDEIDRTIERDQRLQRAADTTPSLWARLRSVFRPVFVPVGAAAGVAALAVAVWSGASGPADGTNNAAVVASKPAPVVAPVLTDTPVVADAAKPKEPEVVLPEPNGGPAHIERIEWSGRSGRISEIEGKRATTTVIWISDDDDSSGSERSL